MNLPYRVLMLSAVLAVSLPVAAAGVVNVAFVDASKYADAGTQRWEEDDNLRVIERHLKQLGQRHLRDGEVLKIDVLDVDLAGWVRPSRATGGDVRIVRGGADWPSIDLRYSLETGGKVVASGSETVSDMNYSRGLHDRRSHEPLRYEKRMLERWFVTTFVDRRAVD